jgi:hypothetical protein
MLVFSYNKGSQNSNNSFFLSFEYPVRSWEDVSPLPRMHQAIQRSPQPTIEAHQRKCAYKPTLVHCLRQSFGMFQLRSLLKDSTAIHVRVSNTDILGAAYCISHNTSCSCST